MQLNIPLVSVLASLASVRILSLRSLARTTNDLTTILQAQLNMESALQSVDSSVNSEYAAFTSTVTAVTALESAVASFQSKSSAAAASLISEYLSNVANMGGPTSVECTGTESMASPSVPASATTAATTVATTVATSLPSSGPSSGAMVCDLY